MWAELNSNPWKKIKQPNLKNNQAVFWTKEVKNELIEQANKLKNDIKWKWEKLAGEEYNEFIKKIEKNKLDIEQNNQVDKNLAKRLWKSDLEEFRRDIDAIKKIKFHPDWANFIEFINKELTEQKQEKLYDKINKTKNLDNILIFLFWENRFPVNGTELRNFFKNKTKIKKSFRVIEKEYENINNTKKIKLDNISSTLEKIKRIKNVLSGSKLNKIEKINIDLISKKDDLISKKDGLISKKDDLKEQEKQKQEQEKQKQEQEKQKQEKNNLNRIKLFKNYKNNSIFQNLWDESNSIINKVLNNKYEIWWKDIDNLEKVVQKIINILKKWNNLKKFIEEEAENWGEEAYNKAVSFVKSLWDNSLNVSLTKLPDFPHLLWKTPEFPKNIDDFTKKQLMDSLGVDDMSEITQNWDIFTFWDKQIIFEDWKATLYNLSKNWYRMETDMAEMWKWYKEINKFKVKMSFIQEEYKKIWDELNTVNLEKNNYIDKVKNWEIKTTQEEFNEKIKEFDEKINEKMNYLKVLEKKANKITKKYKTFLENNKFEIDKKLEEKQKKTLKFLSKIGFDLIPQSITNQLIENINMNPSLYWFETEIDLENGVLWFKQTLADNLSLENKKNFMNLFIAAIWNPKWFFNIWNIWNDSNIIKEPMNLQTYLGKEFFGTDSASKMKENLKKSKQEK